MSLSVLAYSTMTLFGALEITPGLLTAAHGLTMISLPGLSNCLRAASSASMAVCVTSSGTHCAATRALIKLSPRSRQKKQPLSSAGANAVEWVGRCRNLRHQGSLGYRPASFGGARDSEVAQRLSGDRPPPQLEPAKQFVSVRALEPGVIDFA